MKKSLLVIVGFLTFINISATSLFAGSKVSGTFVANKTCQAYASKNKKNNPDNTQLVIGESYAVKGVNVPTDTTWYQINVPDANPSQRWVYFECGEADVTITEKTPKDPTACSTPNEEDGFVFAVSWQPAFCEKSPKKAECKITDPKVYQASNFTLHGLWPNKQSCGNNYGFCSDQKKMSGSFCNYPALTMQDSTRTDLEKVMPSAANGSCLQRHEWYKHGTCQNRDTNDYYKEAIDFVEQFNTGEVKKLIDANIGKEVSANMFFGAVDKTFGEDAHKRLQIMCYKNMLIDVYINLPKELPSDSKLGTLMLKADEKFRNGCGDSFIIDEIGQ